MTPFLLPPSVTTSTTFTTTTDPILFSTLLPLSSSSSFISSCSSFSSFSFSFPFSSSSSSLSNGSSYCHSVLVPFSSMHSFCNSSTLICTHAPSLSSCFSFFHISSLATSFTLFLVHSLLLLITAEVLKDCTSLPLRFRLTQSFHTLLYCLLLSTASVLSHFLVPFQHHQIWWVLWTLDSVLLIATCRVLQWSIWTLIKTWQHHLKDLFYQLKQLVSLSMQRTRGRRTRRRRRRGSSREPIPSLTTSMTTNTTNAFQSFRPPTPQDL